MFQILTTAKKGIGIFLYFSPFSLVDMYYRYRVLYWSHINLLITKRRLLYSNTQFVPRSEHFYLGYKNQSVYAVSGTSRCLFSDKYKTHKYSVGRTYSF